MLTYVFGFSGEIPIALLRWKFVENRTVELEENAGLALPSNIGELGDSVTNIDLSFHNLRGEFSTRTERFKFSRFVGKLCRAPGRVPNEFAKLTKLENLQLHHNDGLQAPEGVPMHSSYESREEVAAFQAFLK